MNSEFEKQLQLVKQLGFRAAREISINLAVVTSDKEFNLAGNFFYIKEAPTSDVYIEVKINSSGANAISWTKQTGFLHPFNRLYITTPTGQTGTMKILLAAEAPDLFDVIDHRTPTSEAIDGILEALLVANAIFTPLPVKALDASYLIDNAAAVDKGGGKVGIPVTDNPFVTGEILTIANTTNYNGAAWVVDATSSANEVVITAPYWAETFDGVDDSIGLTTPRKASASTGQREFILQNNGSVDVWFGDTTIDVLTKRGTKMSTEDVYILDLVTSVYFVSDAAGKTGAAISLNSLRKS